MEARAAVACLGAHRRSPEAGERTLVPIEDSTTGHLFPVLIRRDSSLPLSGRAYARGAVIASGATGFVPGEEPVTALQRASREGFTRSLCGLNW